jgi:hypothetical protein
MVANNIVYFSQAVDQTSQIFKQQKQIFSEHVLELESIVADRTLPPAISWLNAAPEVAQSNYVNIKCYVLQ